MISDFGFRISNFIGLCALCLLLLIVSGCTTAKDTLGETALTLRLSADAWGTYQSNKNQDIEYREFDSSSKLLKELKVKAVTPETAIAGALAARAQETQALMDALKAALAIAEKAGAK